MIHLKWLGQACFEIKNSKTIITDPHDGDGVGIKPPETKADIVTISHDHFDHANGIELVKGKNTGVVQETGTNKVKGIEIEGINSYHDKAKGSKRGENIIYKFKIEGFNVIHLGDLGHIPNEEKIEELKPVDILLIPVGGNYTIDGMEALEIMEKLNPKITVPMHYKIPGLTVEISTDEEFIQEAMQRGYIIRKENTTEIEELPEKKMIIKLKSQR